MVWTVTRKWIRHECPRLKKARTAVISGSSDVKTGSAKERATTAEQTRRRRTLLLS